MSYYLFPICVLSLIGSLIAISVNVEKNCKDTKKAVIRKKISMVFFLILKINWYNPLLITKNSMGEIKTKLVKFGEFLDKIEGLNNKINTNVN